MKKHPVRVLLLLVVISVITWFGINFLRGNDFDLPGLRPVRYYATFSDVSDLNIGSEVRLNGLIIGEVDQIKETDANVSGIKVRFKMLRKIKLPANSVAYIKESFAGLGSAAVIIEKGDGSTFLADTDTIRTRPIPDSLKPASVKEITTRILQGMKEIAGRQDSLRLDTGRVSE